MGLSASAMKAIRLRQANPFQQFGQNGDAYTANGATGCTHTVLQFLALLWGKGFYTHDAISKMVGYPNQSLVSSSNQRGLRPSEVQAFCNKVGLPYAVKIGMSPSAVITASQIAPVGFGHAYSWVPEWKGFVYYGRVADGSPNGYAQPAGHAGKTQLSGFTGAHFGCLLGAGQGASSYQVYSWEPNHGSPARPEKPPYDIYSLTQFNNLYTSYQRVLGRSLYALMPTRPLP